MDYAKHYAALVARRRNIRPAGYTETHHITPRALGGGDDEDNLVELTAREHFVAHLLLAKIHGGAMWAAAAYMSRGGVKSASGVRCSSRLYAMLSREDASWRREAYSGCNNPFFGQKHDGEALSKMRKPRRNKSGLFGRKLPWVGAVIASVLTYRPRAVTVDTAVRDRIDGMFAKDAALLRLNKHLRQREAQQKVARDHTGANNPNYGNGAAISGESNPMWGKTHKQSTLDKISEKAKRTLACPHCGKESNIANAHRWHFDNCKHRNS